MNSCNAENISEPSLAKVDLSREESPPLTCCHLSTGTVYDYGIGIELMSWDCPKTSTESFDRDLF